MPTRYLISVLVAASILAPGFAGAEMYRWVDRNGLTHYGDRVPPGTSKQRREVIDPQGHIISVIEREPTAEERDAAQAKREQAIAAQAVAERQAQYDRSLTATYTDVEQLDAAYQDRLAIIDSKIKSAGNTRADIRATLDSLYERAAGKHAEAGLDKRIKQDEARLAEQDAIVERLRSDRLAIDERYQADRKRYLLLTADRH